MKNVCRSMMTLMILLLLASCVSKYKSVVAYHPPSSKNGQSCVQKCKVTRTNCQSVCHAGETNCDDVAWLRAEDDYDNYLKKQNVEGKPVYRDLSSFYNPLQCDKSACQCEEDFRVCYQMCGGKTSTMKRCVKNCD